MLFSKRSNYGIQALIFLNKFKNQKKYFKSKEIAKQLGLKPSYLTKILQDMAKAGILISTTGPEGGFALSEDNEKLNLLYIYHYLENKDILKDCIMGWKPCNPSNPCPLHEIWDKNKIEIMNRLHNISINDASYSFWPELNYIVTEK